MVAPSAVFRPSPPEYRGRGEQEKSPRTPGPSPPEYRGRGDKEVASPPPQLRLRRDVGAELAVGDQAGVLVLLRRAARPAQALAVPLLPRPARQQLQAHRPQAQALALGGVLDVQ